VNLVPIGRFSVMTRLSVRALRRYDEMGMLAPAHVDASSGYRYYTLGQANRAEAIRILRSVDMPLDAIRSILDADDPGVTHKQLLAHRDQLAERLAAHERMLVYLEALILRKDQIMPYDVEITQGSPQLVAATRFDTNLREIGADIATGFGTLMRGIDQEGLAPAGAPLIVYHTAIDEMTDGGVEVELCVPIGSELVGSGEVYSRELEGGPMATTIHNGPYEQVGPAYHTLTGWISEHGHEITGPPRETYLNDPQTTAPEHLRTQVDFPIDAEPG